MYSLNDVSVINLSNSLEQLCINLFYSSFTVIGVGICTFGRVLRSGFLCRIAVVKLR